MASTYTANSGIEKPGSGEQSGTWGTTTNTNFDIIDRVLSGVGAITLSTTHLTAAQMALWLTAITKSLCLAVPHRHQYNYY